MRVGIVGAGSMGAAHSAGWAKTDAKVVGIVANRDGSADKLASQYGYQIYRRYEDLLNDVDIIDICTPTDLHYDMVTQAAGAGKHIICEKPIALTAAHGRAMIEACNRANVRLFIAHVVRFFSAYRIAQETAASGQIGRPAVIRLTRVAYQPRKAVDNWFTDENRSGGMVTDMLIHDYDYARWVGGEVKRVFAKSARALRPDAPGDYALITLRFESGAIGHIEGGWVYPPGFFRTSLDISGTNGVIEWSSDHSNPLHVHLAAPPTADASDVPSTSSIDEDPYAIQIQHFYDAVINNKPFAVTAEDGLAALEIALAVRESLKTGRSVDIRREA
jgi:predicted dehydrogenase